MAIFKRGGEMTVLWKIKCPKCGRESWTNADTVYNKIPTTRKCSDCKTEFMTKLNVIDKKIVR